MPGRSSFYVVESLKNKRFFSIGQKTKMYILGKASFRFCVLQCLMKAAQIGGSLGLGSHTNQLGICGELLYLMNSREKEKDKYWVPPLNNSQKIQQYLKQKMAKLIMKQFMYEDTTQLILCIINIRQQDNRMPHPPAGVGKRLHLTRRKLTFPPEKISSWTFSKIRMTAGSDICGNNFVSLRHRR